MKFKKLMLVLTFTVSIIFVTVIGATYAYYATSSGSFNITSGTFNKSVGVVFANSDYIDLNTGVPISSSNITTEASTLTFTLTPSAAVAEDYDIDVIIGLSNISIDSALKVSDFKYRLVCRYTDSVDTVGTDQIFNGTASSFTTSSYTIASLSTTESGSNEFKVNTNDGVTSQIYNCTLYIWLEDNGLNQNSLMGKHFSANVEVISTMKKR